MITLWAQQSAVTLTHLYLIVNRSLLSDLSFPELAVFSSGQIVLSSDGLLPSETGGSLVYKGRGLLGAKLREVTSWASPGGYRIEIEGIGHFSVTDDGQHIIASGLHLPISPLLLTEAALGPCLILALALQGTFTLHASAALDPAGNLLLFAGESGRGKSTLARYLGQQPGWRRVADDILPVELEAAQLMALPHFPQLKISPDRQPAVGLPQRLPISALYVLGEPAADVCVEPLSPLEGALALVRHTVASRLFARPLLTRHMAFVQTAALKLPVRRLHYPHRHNALPVVQDALVAGNRERMGRLDEDEV
ncbi:MAG: hypothetical protein ACP5GX_00395 [Anaerolineae bacterium]